jgi:hypothetical protein
MANPVQPSSRAIAVLTRGYVERAKYDELINRNRKISLILQIREIPLVYGQFEADEAFVTRGLNIWGQSKNLLKKVVFALIPFFITSTYGPDTFTPLFRDGLRFQPVVATPSLYT